MFFHKNFSKKNFFPKIFFQKKFFFQKNVSKRNFLFFSKKNSKKNFSKKISKIFLSTKEIKKELFPKNFQFFSNKYSKLFLEICFKNFILKNKKISKKIPLAPNTEQLRNERRIHARLPCLVFSKSNYKYHIFQLNVSLYSLETTRAQVTDCLFFQSSANILLQSEIMRISERINNK